ncbi:helix-turn-helix transcriptional regulator, partial [Candidatus Bathyarchaeota archaeon]|nr:helix-turn-helix transcriptional regulator [Candidatus Bathyarchaeota archaeon]
MSSSDEDVIMDIKKKIVNDFLDLLILLHLYFNEGSFSGYDVLKHLQDKYGLFLSPGTVYSCLYNMERQGFLRGFQRDRRRVYALTKHGVEMAQAIIKNKGKILNLFS